MNKDFSVSYGTTCINIVKIVFVILLFPCFSLLLHLVT